MAELLAAKIVVQEEEPQVRKIPTGPTATTAAVGVTERGPVGVATKVTSPEDYSKKFGGYSANALDLPLAVANFFDEGGQAIYITRTVHYTDPATPATKTSAAATGTIQTAALGASAGSVLGTVVEPFSIVHLDKLDLNVDGGGTQSVNFAAIAAIVTAGNTETYSLSDGQTLTVKIDGGGVQTVTFNTAEFVSIGAATALEVAAVMNAELTGCSVDVNAGAPRITSDTLGTDSGVEVTGGTANTALGFPTSPSVGSGNISDASALTAAEVKTVVEANTTGITVTDENGQVRISSDTTGPTSSIQVEATSTMDTKLGFDNATHTGAAAGAVDTLQVDGKYDGEYANSLSIEIAAATSGVATEFNLRVLESGVLVEVFPNVTMDDTLTNFVETIVNDENNGSVLITVTDLDAALTSPDDRPANGSTSLTGGDDGLTGLDDNDFIGSSVGLTGIRSLDQINDVRLLIVPGRATSAVQNSMITYAEVIRDESMLAILDPPAGLTAAQIITYVKATAALKGLSEFGAIYWPRIKVDNPSRVLYGNEATIVAAPSGALAGMFARVDGASPGGVYEAPAGIEIGQLRTMRGVETTEVNDERKRDLVYPELINPIVSIEGEPRHVDGARTLKEDGNFPTVGERRGVIFISTSLKSGLKFAKFRKIKQATRKRLERTTRLFLIIQTNNDAFASDIPSEAFFVDFSEALNPPSVAFGRKIVGRVGLATAKPAEYIIIRLSQDTRAIQAELAEAA